MGLREDEKGIILELKKYITKSCSMDSGRLSSNLTLAAYSKIQINQQVPMYFHYDVTFYDFARVNCK